MAHLPRYLPLALLVASCTPGEPTNDIVAPVAAPAVTPPVASATPVISAGGPGALAMLPVLALLGPAPDNILNHPTPRRYVAVLHAANVQSACPPAKKVGGNAIWTAKPLFLDDALSKELSVPGGLAVSVPPALNRFCTYESTIASPSPPSFDPTDAKKIARIDPDHDVLMPQAAPRTVGDAVQVRSALADSFLKAMGVRRPDDPPVSHPSGQPVAVAVIDTVPYGVPRNYDKDPLVRLHGLAMDAIISAVRCHAGTAGSDCRRRTFFVPAFPYTADTAALKHSVGVLGSRGSLAHAIGEALLRWRVGPTRRAPLVLNLSVGWDPVRRVRPDLLTPDLPNSDKALPDHTALLITPSDKIDASVQAVHAALVYASCLGALPIAAAGNNTGAACEEQGLLAPAAWERYPAPSPERCDEMFKARHPGPKPPKPASNPLLAARNALVYAAGGVMTNDRPIPNARSGGTPRRVLPAFQVVAQAGPGTTDAWTGTSVAAAALSGLAASAWSHFPLLTAHQLMKHIDASGVAIDDLPVGSQTSVKARRLSGFAAFQKLCTELSVVPCPNPYKNPNALDPSDKFTMPAPVVIAKAALTIISALPGVKGMNCTQTSVKCGAGTRPVKMCMAAGAQPLPQVVSPWLRPQPDIPLCSVCPIKTGKLTLSLNRKLMGEPPATLMLRDATLEFPHADGVLRAGLGDITVSNDGLTLSLADYRPDGDAGFDNLADALVKLDIHAGTLRYVVDDFSTAPMASAVEVR